MPAPQAVHFMPTLSHLLLSDAMQTLFQFQPTLTSSPAFRDEFEAVAKRELWCHLHVSHFHGKPTQHPMQPPAPQSGSQVSQPEVKPLSQHSLHAIFPASGMHFTALQRGFSLCPGGCLSSIVFF